MLYTAHFAQCPIQDQWSKHQRWDEDGDDAGGYAEINDEEGEGDGIDDGNECDNDPTLVLVVMMMMILLIYCLK